MYVPLEKIVSPKVTLTPSQKSQLEIQVGGNHYKQFKIQPIEFCHANNIGYLESTAIKYLCRWRDKGGLEDLDKAIHYIQVLKELESANTTGT